MAQTKKVELIPKEITVENSSEFSLQVVLAEDADESIKQEVLEIAIRHSLRSYNNMIFTSPSETVLRDFQREILSNKIDCEFVLKSSLSKALS